MRVVAVSQGNAGGRGCGGKAADTWHNFVRNLSSLKDGRFLSSETTESTVERKREGKEAGATGWIVKPFDPAPLIATMHKVLR